MSLLYLFLRDESGATAIEYALIALPGAPARDLPSSELRELDAASFRSILIGFLDDAIPNSR